MVRPVHEPPEVVPFVHAAHGDAIPETDGDAPGEIEVVRDQQRLPLADVDDESLVTRAVVVVMQKAADEARGFDPPPIIVLVKADVCLPYVGAALYP